MLSTRFYIQIDCGKQTDIETPCMYMLNVSNRISRLLHFSYLISIVISVVPTCVFFLAEPCTTIYLHISKTIFNI